MSTGNVIAMMAMLLLAASEGCLRRRPAARAVVEVRVNKDAVVTFGGSKEFARQVGKLAGNSSIAAADLKITPYRDTSLLEFRATAATSSAAVERVSAMVGVMREHFDPLVREQLVNEIEPTLATDGMSEEEKELARKIQRGISRASVVLVDRPKPIGE